MIDEPQLGTRQGHSPLGVLDGSRIPFIEIRRLMTHWGLSDEKWEEIKSRGTRTGHKISSKQPLENS